MMSEAYWQGVLAALNAPAPIDLDTPVARRTAAEPASHREPPLPPSRLLWTPADPRWSCIGVRVAAPLTDPAALALRLAAAAIERQVLPIILTPLDRSGLERFGFRTERLAGATEAERQACEAEVTRFWNLAIVIDAADVLLLG